MALFPLLEGDGLARVAEVEDVQDQPGEAETLVEGADMPGEGLQGVGGFPLAVPEFPADGLELGGLERLVFQRPDQVGIGGEDAVDFIYLGIELGDLSGTGIGGDNRDNGIDPDPRLGDEAELVACNQENPQRGHPPKQDAPDAAVQEKGAAFAQEGQVPVVFAFALGHFP